MDFPIWHKKFTVIDVDESVLLINAMVDVNASIVKDWYYGSDPITPLMSLCLVTTDTTGAILLFSYLQSKGALVNHPNAVGNTPYDMCLNPTLLTILIRTPTFQVPNPSIRLVYLMMEAKTDARYTDSILLLIDSGAQIDCINHDFQTPLTVACELHEPGRTRIVTKLIERGANPNGLLPAQLELVPQLPPRRRKNLFPIDALIKSGTCSFSLFTLFLEHPLLQDTPLLVLFRDHERPIQVRYLELKLRKGTSGEDLDWVTFIKVLFKENIPENREIKELVKRLNNLRFPNLPIEDRNQAQSVVPDRVSENIASFLFGDEGKRK
jgi:hypothetical protein